MTPSVGVAAANPAQAAVQAALVAATARAGTAVALQPLVTLKTNIEAGGRCPPGLVAAARWLWRSGGPAALYRGLAATLARDVPYSSVYFAVYTQTKALLLLPEVGPASSDSGGRGDLERLLRLGAASACGSTVATVATHPADVVKTHRQLGGSGGVLRQPSLRQLLAGIRTSEGSLAAGLLRGLAPRLLRRLGFACLSWVTFEELHRLRQRRRVSRAG